MPHPEDNFDTLRRALKLKRHEQPPPGYFTGFSREVISRIRRDGLHTRISALEAVTWEAPWLERVLGWFQARPLYPSLAAMAACLVVIGGVIYSERPAVTAAESGTATIGQPQEIAGFGAAPAAPRAPEMGFGSGPLGALPPGSTLFDRSRSLQTAPVFGVTNLLQPPQP